MPCECDLRHRRWNPNTGRCETCRCNHTGFRTGSTLGRVKSDIRKMTPQPMYGGPESVMGAAVQKDVDAMTLADLTRAMPVADVSGKIGHAESADMTEEEFLREYRKELYPKPSVTPDLVIFTILNNDLKVLLVKRGGHPYKGFWALPGGFLNVKEGVDGDQGEDLDACAHRELAEETGLPEGSCFLEQLYTFGRAGRDPRTRVVSVAYYALISPDKAKGIRAGDDATDAKWASVAGELLDVRDMYKRMQVLAFDHTDILHMGLDRIRGKIDYAPIAFELVPPTFTVAELRRVYEAVQGRTYDPANFTKRFRRMVADGILVQAPGHKQGRAGGRPAKVYKFNRG